MKMTFTICLCVLVNDRFLNQYLKTIFSPCKHLFLIQEVSYVTQGESNKKIRA